MTAAEPCCVGQRLLRQLLLFAELPDARAELLEGRMSGWFAGLAGHAADTCRLVSEQATPDRVQRPGRKPPFIPVG